MRRAWPLLALGLCVAGVVRADPYKGVEAGSDADPPRARSVRRAKVQLMTWPGFQMLPGGGSRVFVQTSREPRFETKRKKGRFVLLLKRTRIHVRNSRRPLETRYFNTPVERVKVKRRGKDLAIVLHLRADATPRVRSKKGEQGRYHYVYLDFPAGQWIEGATPSASDEGEEDSEPQTEEEARPPRDDDGQARDSERPPDIR